MSVIIKVTLENTFFFVFYYKELGAKFSSANRLAERKRRDALNPLEL